MTSELQAGVFNDKVVLRKPINIPLGEFFPSVLYLCLLGFFALIWRHWDLAVQVVPTLISSWVSLSFLNLPSSHELLHYMIHEQEGLPCRKTRFIVYRVLVRNGGTEEKGRER